MVANNHGSGQDWHAPEIHLCRKGIELTGTHPLIPAGGFSLEQLSMCCLSPDHLEWESTHNSHNSTQLSFPNMKNGEEHSSSVKLGHSQQPNTWLRRQVEGRDRHSKHMSSPWVACGSMETRHVLARQYKSTQSSRSSTQMQGKWEAGQWNPDTEWEVGKTPTSSSAFSHWR